MITRVVGDIHGSVNAYFDLVAINDDSTHSGSIQIGDFGLGFVQSKQWHSKVDKTNLELNSRFIRGNHDKPAECRKMKSWIPDGVVEDGIMFIGGAWSIDNPNAPPGWYRRTKNVNWWAGEECSDAQFEQFMKTYLENKPRVLITHDCPDFVAREIFWKNGIIQGEQYYHRTGEWLGKMAREYEPDFVFFGHWHHSIAQKIGKTIYVCLDELDHIDIDLSDSDKIYQEVQKKFNI